MNEEEVKAIIRKELPHLLEDSQVRDFVMRTVHNFYAGKEETESRFDRVLEALERDRAESRQQREEQRRLWDEQRQRWEVNDQRWQEQLQLWEEQRQQQEVNDQRWEEQRQQQEVNDQSWQEQRQLWDEQRQRWEVNDQLWQEQRQKWEANDQRFQEMLQEIREVNRKHDSTIGALGARWGLYSEESFRNALAGILSESFGVEVVRIEEYDEQGEVFGRPDQIELDVLIHNGLLIICEIKSSMSKPDMYIFEKKVRFYQKQHDRTANRKIVVSPMVHPKAQQVAPFLGIEVYSYAGEVWV
jgi:hypothetical protein